MECNVSEALSNITKVQIRRQRLPGILIPLLATFQRFFTKDYEAADTTQEDPTLCPFNAILTEVKSRTRKRRGKDSPMKSPRYTRNVFLVPQIRNRSGESKSCKYSKFHNLQLALELLQKFTTSFCRQDSLQSSKGFNPDAQISRYQHKLQRQRMKNIKKKAPALIALEAAYDRRMQDKKERLEREDNKKKSNRGKPKK